MTRCVQMLGVGVPAQTSAWPVDTSAVGEPAWIPATFMKGEFMLCMHKYSHAVHHDGDDMTKRLIPDG